MVVERGAGLGANYSDADYEAAGATVAPDGVLRNADIVLKVRGPQADEIPQFKRGAILVSLLSPATERESIGKLAEAGVDAFAMEFLPRISRAQAMDVLSSQANLAGYKAVIDAAAAVRPRHADDDDGRRHHRACARARDGRGRRRPAGDRDREAAGRDRLARPTCVPRPRSRSRSLGRHVRRGHRRRVRGRPDGGRLRQRNVGGVSGQAGRADRRDHQEAGHRHHHRADPRPQGAACW